MSKADTVIQYLKYDAKIGFHFLTRRELCGIFFEILQHDAQFQPNYWTVFADVTMPWAVA